MPREELLQLVDRGPVADPGGNVPDSTSASGAARDEVASGPEDFAAFYRRELGGLVVLARALAGVRGRSHAGSPRSVRPAQIQTVGSLLWIHRFDARSVSSTASSGSPRCHWSRSRATSAG